MERRLLPPCVLFAATILLVHTAVSSVAAQNQNTREGIITSFAPGGEKVAPSVVTVFTAQTAWRGLTTSPCSDDRLRQFCGGQLPQGRGKQPLQGLGSGVSVSPGRCIL